MNFKNTQGEASLLLEQLTWESIYKLNTQRRSKISEFPVKRSGYSPRQLDCTVTQTAWHRQWIQNCGRVEGTSIQENKVPTEDGINVMFKSRKESVSEAVSVYSILLGQRASNLDESQDPMGKATRIMGKDALCYFKKHTSKSSYFHDSEVCELWLE